MRDYNSWSEQEEAKILELTESDIILDGKKTGKHPTRPEAVRMMQRLKASKKWRPTDV